MNDVEESEGLPSLDKPGWYSQGNWLHLHELLKTMTGKPEPKVRQPAPVLPLPPEHFRLTLKLTQVFGRHIKKRELHDKSAQGDSHWCDRVGSAGLGVPVDGTALCQRAEFTDKQVFSVPSYLLKDNAAPS